MSINYCGFTNIETFSIAHTLQLNEEVQKIIDDCKTYLEVAYKLIDLGYEGNDYGIGFLDQNLNTMQLDRVVRDIVHI